MIKEFKKTPIEIISESESEKDWNTLLFEQLAEYNKKLIELQIHYECKKDYEIYIEEKIVLSFEVEDNDSRINDLSKKLQNVKNIRDNIKTKIKTIKYRIYVLFPIYLLPKNPKNQKIAFFIFSNFG